MYLRQHAERTQQRSCGLLIELWSFEQHAGRSVDAGSGRMPCAPMSCGLSLHVVVLVPRSCERSGAAQGDALDAHASQRIECCRGGASHRTSEARHAHSRAAEPPWPLGRAVWARARRGTRIRDEGMDLVHHTKSRPRAHLRLRTPRVLLPLVRVAARAGRGLSIGR